MPTNVGARSDGSTRAAGYIRHLATQVIRWLPDISGARAERVIVGSARDICTVCQKVPGHVVSVYRTTTMGSTFMILVSLTTMSMVCDNILAGMPTQCNPGYLDDLPPRIRKVCAALSRMYEFGPEIESYVDETQNHIPGFHESIPLLDSGVKRQDVDHIFLRFGRRR